MRRTLQWSPVVLAVALVACGAPTPSEPAFSTLIPTQDESADLPDEPVGEAASSLDDEDSFAQARERMVSTQIEARGVDDPVVLEAMRNVPRHEFVPDEFLSQAYNDHPLPIGYGQTISQPFVVALMTQALLEQRRVRNVLEIGTGCGYQSAVLARLVPQIYNANRWGADNSDLERINTVVGNCAGLDAFAAAHPDAIGPPT